MYSAKERVFMTQLETTDSVSPEVRFKVLEYAGIEASLASVCFAKCLLRSWSVLLVLYEDSPGRVFSVYV